MKNKSITYILIVGVLIVWGLIFYRIFSGMGGEEELSGIPSVANKKAVISNNEEEPLVLIANYRDPFLGTVSNTLIGSNYNQGTNQIVIKRKLPIVKKEVVLIDWSFLDYIGIVQNKETKKKVGLLNILGKEFMVSEGDTVNEVLVLKKERDSIFVKYKEEKKWIRR